jgi:hypothetical protein
LYESVVRDEQRPLEAEVPRQLAETFNAAPPEHAASTKLKIERNHLR